MKFSSQNLLSVSEVRQYYCQFSRVVYNLTQPEAKPLTYDQHTIRIHQLILDQPVNINFSVNLKIGTLRLKVFIFKLKISRKRKSYLSSLILFRNSFSCSLLSTSKFHVNTSGYNLVELSTEIYLEQVLKAKCVHKK